LFVSFAKRKIDVQVELARRYQVGEGDRDMLLKQVNTLRHEGRAMLRTVLVRRADDLGRGYQPPVPVGVAAVSGDP
jgi:hypothetical protein